MIPKIIHYCWFGGKNKPAIVRKCIKSWKKHCPDYQIIEWNESNFDVNCIQFCLQAYEAKKWAFVTDYVRLKVIYDMGGIYMDTDVELVKPLDNFLAYDCFLGFQHENYVATGLVCGARPRHEFIGENAMVYENMQFIDELDSRKLVVCQEYTTDLLKKRGLLVPGTKDIQELKGITVFPPEYFCPYDHRTGVMNDSENTVAIHHFASSWWDKKRKKEYRKNKRKNVLYEISHVPNKLLKKYLGEQNYERLKNWTKKG